MGPQSRCVDLVAAFACVCPADFTGRLVDRVMAWHYDDHFYTSNSSDVGYNNNISSSSIAAPEYAKRHEKNFDPFINGKKILMHD